VMLRISFLDSIFTAAVAAHAYSQTSPATGSPIETRWTNILSFAKIGETYLHQHPDEADAALLRRLLFKNASPPTLRALRGLIAKLSANDFLHCDVVILGGWIFARSEARICALASLAMSRAY
jgi:hypothetical protein